MQSIRDSFDRARQADFARRFYLMFLGSDASIRRKFEKTDFEQQRALLVHGVYSMLDYAEGRPLGKLALDRLAVRHGPGELDVIHAMYERWLACFLETLRVTDPAFDERLAEEWRAALRPGLDRIAALARSSGAKRHVTSSGRS